MEAKIYAELLKDAVKKRGNEPQTWWISHDHESNILKPFIRDTVLIKERDHYDRELSYQKELYRINELRLAGIENPIKGRQIRISNSYLSDNEKRKHIRSLPIKEVILVTVCNDKYQIDKDGGIYLFVQYSNHYFSIMIDDIIKDN